MAKKQYLPVRFRDEMVRSTLGAYPKLQFREPLSQKLIINQEPDRYKFCGLDRDGAALFEDLRPEITPWIKPIPCPFGEVGQLLYVQEAFIGSKQLGGTWVREKTHFRADDFWLQHPGPWSPSSTMPRELARLILQVQWIRVERLQSLSRLDIHAEDRAAEINGWVSGIARENACIRHRIYEARRTGKSPNDSDICRLGDLATYWDAQYNKRGLGWHFNPWVWVVGFRVVKGGGEHLKNPWREDGPIECSCGWDARPDTDQEQQWLAHLAEVARIREEVAHA